MTPARKASWLLSIAFAVIDLPVAAIGLWASWDASPEVPYRDFVFQGSWVVIGLTVMAVLTIFMTEPPHTDNHSEEDSHAAST